MTSLSYVTMDLLRNCYYIP